MKEMREDSKFKLLADVRFRVVDDDGVIIRQSEGEVILVNELGGQILTLIQQQQSLTDIVAALKARYSAEPTEVMEDTRAFLKEMLTSQVIDFTQK